MDYLEWIYKIANGLAGAGFLVGIIILWKTGLLEFITNLKKNGNGNGKNEEIKQLKVQIATLQDNHLHALGEKVDKLTERMIEHNAEEIIILNDIRNILKK